MAPLKQAKQASTDLTTRETSRVFFLAVSAFGLDLHLRRRRRPSHIAFGLELISLQGRSCKMLPVTFWFRALRKSTPKLKTEILLLDSSIENKVQAFCMH